MIRLFIQLKNNVETTKNWLCACITCPSTTVWYVGQKKKKKKKKKKQIVCLSSSNRPWFGKSARSFSFFFPILLYKRILTLLLKIPEKGVFFSFFLFLYVYIFILQLFILKCKKVLFWRSLYLTFLNYTLYIFVHYKTTFKCFIMYNHAFNINISVCMIFGALNKGQIYPFKTNKFSEWHYNPKR